MPYRLAFGMLLSFTLTLGAQKKPTPPSLFRTEAGECARCILTLTYVATVGSAADKELVKDSGTLLALPSGGFLVWGEGPLLRYTTDGRYLGTLGRMGDGPGEYRGQKSVVAARGDSISIFSYGKLTTIALANGKGRSVQSEKLLSAFRHIALPDGGALVQNYATPTPSFVVLASDATMRRAFGPKAKTVMLPINREGPDFYSQQFLVTSAEPDGFWAAPVYYEYGLERWSLNGEKVRTIQRTPRWFVPYDYDARQEAQARGGGNARPLPFLAGLWSDDRGRVFILTRTADANWKADPGAPKPGVAGAGGERRYVPWVPTGGLARYYDGMIDAYDGSSGAFLGSWRTDAWVSTAIGQGMLATRVESDGGVISFQVWRVNLREP